MGVEATVNHFAIVIVHPANPNKMLNKNYKNKHVQHPTFSTFKWRNSRSCCNNCPPLLLKSSDCHIIKRPVRGRKDSKDSKRVRLVESKAVMMKKSWRKVLDDVMCWRHLMSSGQSEGSWSWTRIPKEWLWRVSFMDSWGNFWWKRHLIPRGFCKGFSHCFMVWLPAVGQKRQLKDPLGKRQVNKIPGPYRHFFLPITNSILY